MLNRIIIAVALLPFLLAAGRAQALALNAPINATVGIGNCTVPQGPLNTTSCGASGSAQSTTGSISAGSNHLTLAAVLDFVNGEGVAISHAGPANTAVAPTGFSAALPAWPGAWSPLPYNSTGSGHQYLIRPVNNNSGNNIYELNRVSGQGLTSGSEPTWSSNCSAANSTCTDYGIAWTQHTTNYTTVYTYKLAGLDTNFGISAATAGFTCTGPSSLSELSPCVVKWTAGANDVGVLIYRNNALIAVVPASDGSFNDEGYLIPNVTGPGNYWPDFPTSPPASALPGRLVTTISSGAGTTNLTLAASATTASTSQAVNHDDTAALHAWASALMANSGSYGYCPQGTYQITSPITVMPPGSDLTGVGTHISGPAGLNAQPAGCRLLYNGDPNRAVFYTNALWNSTFDQLTFDSNALALYGVQVDNSDGTHPSNEVVFDKISTEKVSPSINAVGIEFGHPGMGAWQVSEMTVDDSFVYQYDGGPPNIANAGIRTEAPEGNLKDFNFFRNTIDGFAYAYRLGGDGTTTIVGGNILNDTGADIWDDGDDQQLYVNGIESEGDLLTGNRFFGGGAANAHRALQLQANSWESATPTDDVVVQVGGAILIGNTFQNGRTPTSQAKIVASAADNAAPGSNSGGLISLYNSYENIPSPYLPPIYDGSGNQLTDFVNGYPVAYGGTAPVFSFGDKTFNPSNGNAVNLVNVSGFGGDQVLTRLFAAGKPGVPIIDANGGSPLLENVNVELNSLTFSTLKLAINGTAAFCSDCKNSIDDGVTVGAACTGGGHGALAIRINSANRCY
jgi:hypothetical protein